MCGIIGIYNKEKTNFVNEQLIEGLTYLQHRGQDSAGIATLHENTFQIYKNKGLVSEVFHSDNISSFRGNIGLGHVRYSTLHHSNIEEAQPLYINYPNGICLVHNGNISNSQQLKKELKTYNRHINSNSDSEILLNMISVEKEKEENIFLSILSVMKKCQGGYSVLLLIPDIGLIAFRDPHGIRPLCFGKSINNDYLFASESVVMDGLDNLFIYERDVDPGECILIKDGISHSIKLIENPILTPCLFEYIYFSRPDSVLDGISIYEARKNMGLKLANRIIDIFTNEPNTMDMDCIIPVPDTSRITALKISEILRIPYQEGFIKNRYVGRTFILPEQNIRQKSIQLKMNTIKYIFQNKNVLIVDDSIVRGNTSKHIVKLAKKAGAKKIYFCSAAPPVLFPNVYGINIPSSNELIAFQKSLKEIEIYLGVDKVIYNTLEDVIEACNLGNSKKIQFETSCFNGIYI